MVDLGQVIRKAREKKYPGRGGLTICAEAYGVSPQYWRDWETGKRKPGARNQIKLAAFFGVTVADLVGDKPSHSVPPPSPAFLATTSKGIPVIGLAECGVSGWYTARPIAIHATLPSHERIFAVVAIGKSMIPDGIVEGHLAYCDPTIDPIEGDAVFIKTTDGKASIKKFLKWENEWLHVLGWLDPDKQGIQKPFATKMPQNFIESICCVVMVQRRA